MTSRALRLDEIWSIDQLTAAIALVTLGIRVVAHRALTTHVSVSQEAVTLRTIKLIDHLIESVAARVEVVKYLLGDFGVYWGRCPAKDVEVAIEPLVYFLVNLVVFVADLTRCLALLLCFGFSRCAVFIRAADVDRVVACESAVSCVHVC